MQQLGGLVQENDLEYCKIDVMIRSRCQTRETHLLRPAWTPWENEPLALPKEVLSLSDEVCQ